jgi:branched-subunit amino acid aminotransferase/4-amino-4-deoxychorismate lyase
MSDVYFNGQFLEASEASVSVFDGGFLHGAGLFETMRAENGRVFRLESHVQRLRNSAARLLRAVDREQLPSAGVFGELLERNSLRTARIRLTFTAGSLLETEEGVPRPPTICVTATPLVSYPEGVYERGITVVICQFRQSPGDPTAGHKTTAYLPRLLGLREAQAARCLEAIWFTTTNHLAEGSISNVFAARDGVLRTPPLDTPVLPGVARSVVLEAAAELDIPVEQRPMTIHDLLDADEVFLTNAIMHVMPVARVEKHDIGNAAVGPVTRKLMAAYRDKVRGECDAA